MYLYFLISAAAFVVVAFLTLRDIRIFKRTGLKSYRHGAVKGIIAMTLVMMGVIIVQVYAEAGMLLVLVGMFVNKKGPREYVFADAKALDRFLGKTRWKDE